MLKLINNIGYQIHSKLFLGTFGKIVEVITTDTWNKFMKEEIYFLDFTYHRIDGVVKEELIYEETVATVNKYHDNMPERQAPF